MPAAPIDPNEQQRLERLEALGLDPASLQVARAIGVKAFGVIWLALDQISAALSSSRSSKKSDTP